MITVSEGHYWSGNSECVPVRVEAEVADELIALNVSSDKGERPNVEVSVYLEPDDASHLAKQLKEAAKKVGR